MLNGFLRCGFAVIAMAMAAATSAAESAPPGVGDGKTVFIRSLATAEAGGLQRALGQKDWIYVADTLRTSAKASARFVMRDHTMLSMQPNTRIVLAEYQFDDSRNDSKMVTTVVAGSLRALTGLVDKRDPDNVLLQTPLATIGVRGTALRVQIFASGKEEIIFDYGHGYVRNQAGRVNVEKGWGARVIAVNILPELFEVDEDRSDPAWLAFDLLERDAPDAMRQATTLAAGLDDGDKILLLGMLEQSPNANESAILAVTEGLLGGSADLHGALLQTAVLLAPDRATRLLQSSVRSGIELKFALGEVLGALIEPKPLAIQQVLDTAVQLGLDREGAERVLEDLDQPTPCRTTPAEGGPQENETSAPGTEPAGKADPEKSALNSASCVPARPAATA